MNTPHKTTFKTFFLSVAAAAVLAGCATDVSTGPVPAGHYRVKPGDTLTQIARRHGQSVATLASWNNLRDTSKIEVGQVLRVRRHAGSRTEAAQSARSVQPVNRIKLQWPVDNGAQNIIGRYDGRINKGIDIAGEAGQPVKAAAAGTVIYVGEEVRGYGRLVLVSHSRNTITAYAHNETLLVQKNQTVSAGQTIAAMGMSDADRVKLHFEVRVNGSAVDPMSYLAEDGTQP